MIYLGVCQILWCEESDDHAISPPDYWKSRRINQTIISMLRKLPDLHKNKWKNHVKKLVVAYNCTKDSTSGY